MKMDLRVERRLDYWRAYQWTITAGRRAAVLLFFPYNKKRKRENSKWRQDGWFNGRMQPISGKQVARFFQWYKRGSFD